MNNKSIKNLIKNNKKLISYAVFIIIVLLIIPIILNPILDNTINKFLKKYVIKYDSNLYSTIITAVIACITAFLGYKYALEQFNSTNKAHIILSAPMLYYYNINYRFCTHKEFRFDKYEPIEMFGFLENVFASRDFEITINNIGKGICENFNIIIDFKNWSFYNEIVENITDDAKEYIGHFSHDTFKKELMYIEQEKETSTYFSNTINTIIAYLCNIDENNNKGNIKKIERLNYFISNKWHKIANINISYDDVFTHKHYINEYDFEINLSNRLRLLCNGIEPKYNVFTNFKQTKSTEIKHNILSTL